MEQWIPFEPGTYAVESAFAVTPQNTAVSFKRVAVKISDGRNGIRSLSGSGLVRPFLLMELSEDSESMDIVLDFGHGYTYRLPRPRISAGKVFSPGVEAMMQFFPVAPWEVLSAAAYKAMMQQVQFLSVD